jgi:hypothetical protein
MVVSNAFLRLLQSDQHRPPRRTLQQMIFLTKSRLKKPRGELNEAGTTVVRHGGRFRRRTSEAPCVHRQAIGVATSL